MDWLAFHEKERRRRVLLPTYPFERRRHWVDPAEPPRGYFAARAGLTRKQETLPRQAEPEVVREAEAPRDAGLRSEYVAPQTDLEKRLAAVWQELLGVDKIGIHDSFFELGGDSLVATQLISRIRATLGMDVPLRRLFETPTVGGFAEFMETIRWTAVELPASSAAQSAEREEVEL